MDDPRARDAPIRSAGPQCEASVQTPTGASAPRATWRSISSRWTERGGSLGVRRRQPAVLAQIPGVDVVGKRALEHVEHLRPHPLVLDRDDQLDPVVEVARHQVGRADQDPLLLAGRSKE